jgi:cyclopropane-fatty-acyl-phospholipid synthase
MTAVQDLRRQAGSLAVEAARGLLVQLASRIKQGSLRIEFPDGSVRLFGQPGAAPAADLKILDPAFYRQVAIGGEIGFGEAYVDGSWQSSDLVSLLSLGILNRQNVSLKLPGLRRMTQLADRGLHLSRRNTADQARENILAHYDLGNDFFRLFLDQTLTYSCAVFSNPEQSLAEAQHTKYLMLCEKARIGRNDHVLEIGSGWGGFAIYAARKYGCRVTTITISQEQLALARRRVEGAGLADQVEVLLCDYRQIDGQYDAVVSIEMLEAVGAEYFPTFFKKVDESLKPGGHAAIQVITVPERNYVALREGVNWVQKYIFPGGMLPSLAEIERSLADSSLVITEVQDIGPHYATTLRRWRAAFWENLAAARALGFDDRFIRMWEYYLASSEASFITRNTSDLQIVLEKPALP